MFPDTDALRYGQRAALVPKCTASRRAAADSQSGAILQRKVPGMSLSLETIGASKAFGGLQGVYSHRSETVGGA